MSTETNANPNGAASNAAPVAPAQPVTAPQSPIVDPNKEPDNDPPWLAKRLEQAKRVAAKDVEANARKALLAELGFDDPEVAKKLAEDDKKRREAQKSLETKLAERDTVLAQKEARLKELEAANKVFADEQIATLSEPQRKAVLDLAGDDPAKQLKAIATLRPTWGTPAPAVPIQVPNGTAPANAAPPIAAPPATPVVSAKPATATAPAPNAPPPAGTTVIPNHLETYEQLQKTHPFAASTYYQAHYAEINEARAKRSN